MTTKEDHLLKKIHQAFKYIFDQEPEIASAQNETMTTLNSVENLSEQLQCCHKVKFQETPLANFTDLQTNLNFKLSNEIEQKMKSLQEFCDLLQEFSLCIDKHHKGVMTLYQNFSKELDVCDLSEGQPTRPAISIMMEWLDDLNQDVYIFYLSRHHLLSTLNCQSSESIARLKREWTYDDKLNKRFVELKYLLKYFMEESA